MTDEQIKEIAIAFRNDNPEDYDDETLDETIKYLKENTSEKFKESAYKMFVAEASA